MAWRLGIIQERLQGIETETNVAQGTATKKLAESPYAQKAADEKTLCFDKDGLGSTAAPGQRRPMGEAGSETDR